MQKKIFIRSFLVRIAMLFLSLSTIHADQEKVENTSTSSTKNKWMDEAIEGEFIKFKKSGISQKSVDATYEAFTKECTDGLNRCRGLVKRYKVINQKVYGEETTVKYLLELMCERYSVPDVDFLYYYQDEIATNNPIIKKKFKKAPILVSAKKKGFAKVVLFFDWLYDITNNAHGWNATIDAINDNISHYPWEEKIEKAFWRGSGTDGAYTIDNLVTYPRGFAVYLSKNNPEYIDAGFTHIHDHFFEQTKEVLRSTGLVSFLNPKDQMQYKYLLDIDGVTFAYPAAYHKFLSNSLVMKQNSDNVMWFSSRLIPWEHFVPVHNDLRDVKEKVQWARENDGEAKKIADSGRQFALDHLMPEQILEYCYKTLVKYASLQTFQPKLTAEEKKLYAE